ncbi:MAG: hypothetical protein LBR19_09140 [Bifidobacteriaceae bacterium]|jgi:hypothetical protein|nr:hypothetical protein [Bifidobacteriaceae bacterium]
MPLSHEPLTQRHWDTHHVLVLADDVEADEIALLAATRWRGVGVGQSEIRLSRHSSLFGPYHISPAVTGRLGLPRGLTAGWVVSTLRERGEPPFRGTLDPTGIARAFQTGLPIREEARVAQFLVAAARRLGGVVRFAESGVMVAPVPDAALDLSVYSPLWMEPEAALATVQQLVPEFDYSISLAPYSLPGGGGAIPDEVWANSGLDALSPDQRLALHDAANARDRQALSTEPELDRYALEVSYGEAGLVLVEISGVEQVPGALRDVDWAKSGAIKYEAKWLPQEPNHLLMEFPPAAHCSLRTPMGGIINDIAATLHAAVGGEVLDSDGFPINPADL